VTSSRDARARAVQLPAWNEALGLPRPWDQQWSLRMQQVLAYESDLLEYEDIFEGSTVIEAKVDEIKRGARAEIDHVLELGGAVAAVESGYLKSALVSSLALRRRRMESGEAIVVGVNKYTESETVDPTVEAAAIEAVRAWRASRDTTAADEAMTMLRDAAKTDTNLMVASLACARAGVTVGEWSGVLREVFGEYRPPTGVAGASGGGHEGGLSDVQRRVRALGEQLGRPLKFLVGKPGLDGHSNGAEQIAVRARDAGFEVVYLGIRLTPAQLVASAVEEDVDVVGLSVLSGSHLSVVPDVLAGLRAAGLDDVPVVVGGIIPDPDAASLRGSGVARIFTPKDFEITDVLGQIVDAIEESRA
jgi:ethylmalonyl-CoA mutase